MINIIGLLIRRQAMKDSEERKISKSNFKNHALEVMEDVEKTGAEIVITSYGRPVLIMKKFTQPNRSPLEKLRGSVMEYISPTTPVDNREL